MRKICLVLALGSPLVSLPAYSQGFWGGMADGAQRAQELELQRRALELDRRDGGHRYEGLRDRQEIEALRREIQKNNELLEYYRRKRIIDGRF